MVGCGASPRPVPVSPGLERIGAFESVRADSLTPTLRWPPVAPPPGLARVTYELRVWRVVHEYPRELVYVREGLPEPQHTLTEPLKPATEYAWTTRARLESDGRVRLSDWRVPYGTRFGVLPHPLYARFVTPPG